MQRLYCTEQGIESGRSAADRLAQAGAGKLSAACALPWKIKSGQVLYFGPGRSRGGVTIQRKLHISMLQMDSWLLSPHLD